MICAWFFGAVVARVAGCGLVIDRRACWAGAREKSTFINMWRAAIEALRGSWYFLTVFGVFHMGSVMQVASWFPVASRARSGCNKIEALGCGGRLVVAQGEGVEGSTGRPHGGQVPIGQHLPGAPDRGLGLAG